MKRPLINFAFYFSAFCVFISQSIYSQTDPFVFGDRLPDAPELAASGPFPVGVRTLELIHTNQPNIQESNGTEMPVYDRPLRVEVWYPAQENPDAKMAEYTDFLGTTTDPTRPLKAFTFPGRAERNAVPDTSQGPYPLVIVSHGYLGSRVLMTYLTENLASKGYLVVAIDHTESTHENPGKFASTLYHRPLDDLFVLEEMDRFNKSERGNFLSGMVDASRTALLGYSMGGYGVLNAAGAGFSPGFVGAFSQMTSGSQLLATRSLSDPNYPKTVDPRVKAIVAVAPWGMQRGVWDSEGLQNLRTPTFFIAGSEDDISGYEDGVKAIYEGASKAERYLLTYLNARHNVAPNPPVSPDLDPADYMHYSEPVWDEERINNINQHFVTAFLGIYLKGLDYGKFLDLPEDSLEETWTGFLPRTSIGLELRQAKP
ncbi:alpha/beta hydrolase family protein [Cyclobacterium xiamenense]|uniref:alpha/beta hydrolase family protein n=1 Tax=Cyclobacterium xiamenense TaxID=1297121 RepID=UPI0012B91323|nr:dienelactone hydrolase [Cyclobacterium xiamenense]